MANPDNWFNKEDRDSDHGRLWTMLVVLVIFWNILIVGNLVLGKIFPGYEKTHFFKVFYNAESSQDNSPSCRYDRECDNLPRSAMK